MKIIRTQDELKSLPDEFCSHITIGSFDGIHLGHQKLISRVVETSRQNNCTPAVFTFPNHPLSLLAPPYKPARLTSDEERIQLFKDLGVKLLILATFDRSLARVTPEEFVKDILLEKLKVRHVVCGYNFRFGKNGGGDEAFLREMAACHGFSVEQVDPVKISHVIVSSTKIRELLTQGLVTLAGEFLGRPYSLKCPVIKGKGRGRHMEYPTANLAPPEDILVPANGVYAVKVVINNHTYNGMMSIGTNPTFPPKNFSLEVHVFDFDGNLVGEELEVRFIKKLRLEIRFDSREDLMEQLRRDEEIARKFL